MAVDIVRERTHGQASNCCGWRANLYYMWLRRSAATVNKGRLSCQELVPLAGPIGNGRTAY